MSGWGGPKPEKEPRCTACGNSGWITADDRRQPCGSCREGKVAGHLAAARPAGQPVLVHGQHPGEAYETWTHKGDVRRWVRLTSGNTGWFPAAAITERTA